MSSDTHTIHSQLSQRAYSFGRVFFLRSAFLLEPHLESSLNQSFYIMWEELSLKKHFSYNNLYQRGRHNKKIINASSRFHGTWKN